MTDYTKLTNFSVKDTLASGNPAKVIRGAEFDAEFNNIQTAVNSKADVAELATETANRQAADQALEDAIDAEEVSRIAADTTLQGNIDAEEASRIAADTTLQSNIDAEEASRIAADTTLQSNIDAEASARQSADNILQGNIDAEASARQSADATLQSNIDLKADIDNPVFTGNVGIGTSTPLSKLHVRDARDIDMDSSSRGQLTLEGSGYSGAITLNEQGLNLYHNSSSRALILGTNEQERMRLTSDGKLGIGTSNPAATLEVNGTGRIGNFSPTSLNLQHTINNISELQGNPSVATTNSTIGVRGDLVMQPRTGVNASTRFFTENSERMRLTSSGYLKVDPSGSYGNAVGSPNLSDRSIHQFNSSANDVTLGVFNTNSSFVSANIVSELNSNSGNHISATTNSSPVFSVKANGDVFSATSTYNSDIKLKENIEDASPKLEDISKIRFVNYNFKEGPRKDIREFGVIAQELEEVFPALVNSIPDTEEVEVTKTETFEAEEPVLDEEGNEVLDEEGNIVTETRTEEREVTTTETVETGTVTKSVKYSVLTLMAVKALQELKAEKDELAVEHESLKDQVRLLTERIEAIESNN